jgi:hypothetical protein
VAGAEALEAWVRKRRVSVRARRARSPRELIDVRKMGGVLSRGLDGRESEQRGHEIHSRRGHRAPEESERQKDKPVHGSTR